MRKWKDPIIAIVRLSNVQRMVVLIFMVKAFSQA